MPNKINSIEDMISGRLYKFIPNETSLKQFYPIENLWHWKPDGKPFICNLNFSVPVIWLDYDISDCSKYLYSKVIYQDKIGCIISEILTYSSGRIKDIFYGIQFEKI